MSHPEPETLAAYHAGELTADEERRLQEHLLACRECSGLLLDLDGLADPGFGAGSLPPADQAALWGRIQGEIKKEETPSAPVVPLRRPAIPVASPRWLQALAAALLIATVGLSAWVVSLQRTLSERSQPQVNTPLAYLFSGTSRSPRPEISTSVDTPIFDLILQPPKARSTNRYRVEITRAGGEIVWRRDGIAPDPLGLVRLKLTPGMLGPGRYQIRLAETGKREILIDGLLRVEGR
jgi:putative zinc finger protein